jgi:hypothetical protein
MSCCSVDMHTVSHQCEFVSVSSDRRLVRMSCCSVDMHTVSHQCEFVSVLETALEMAGL